MEERFVKKLLEISSLYRELKAEGFNHSVLLERGSKPGIHIVDGEKVDSLPEGKLVFMNKPLTDSYPILASVEREGVEFSTYLYKDNCWEAYLE